MSLPLVIAAMLTVGVGVAHSVLGERYIIRRLLRRNDLPKTDAFTRQTIRFAWHLTTIAWFGLAAVLALIGGRLGDPAPTTAVLQSGDPLDTVRAVGAVIATTFAASGVVTVIATRGRHLAWIVFLVIAALVFAAV